jgi:hypothetical protein
MQYDVYDDILSHLKSKNVPGPFSMEVGGEYNHKCFSDQSFRTVLAYLYAISYSVNDLL